MAVPKHWLLGGTYPLLAVRLGALTKTVIGRVLVPGSDFAFGGEPMDVARLG